MLSLCQQTTSRNCGYHFNWLLLEGALLNHIRCIIAWFSSLDAVKACGSEVSAVLQAFLKLRHETKVEHIFLVGKSGKKFEIVLVSTQLHLVNFVNISFRFKTSEARLTSAYSCKREQFNILCWSCRISSDWLRSSFISLVNMTFSLQLVMLSW